MVSTNSNRVSLCISPRSWLFSGHWHTDHIFSFTHSRCSKVKSVPVTDPVVAQRVGRGIALLFQVGGTRRGWGVSSTPRPYFTPGQDAVPIVQEAGWAPGPVWTGGKSRSTGIRSSDRPARASVAIPTELPGPPKCFKRWPNSVAPA